MPDTEPSFSGVLLPVAGALHLVDLPTLAAFTDFYIEHRNSPGTHRFTGTPLCDGAGAALADLADGVWWQDDLALEEFPRPLIQHVHAHIAEKVGAHCERCAWN